MWKIPLSWRASMTDYGRRCAMLMSGHGSCSILNLVPLPTLQASPWLMIGNDFNKDFQIIDLVWISMFVLLIQFSMESGQIYFWWTIFVQRLSMVISLHPTLATSAFENMWMFFRLYPPISFRVAKVSHFIQGITQISFWPSQRNLKHSVLMFSKIPFETQAREAQ